MGQPANDYRDDACAAGRAAAAGADRYARALAAWLAPADIRLDGKRRWDILVRDARAPREILQRGSLGAGEAYMRGWWDSPALDECVCRILRAGLGGRLASLRAAWLGWGAWLGNPQRRARAFAIGRAHYDLGNDLFEAMLDRRMVYSCGYWPGAADLDEAQAQKLALVCEKLELVPGQRLLDIGCGWGSLCEFAARNYGVAATGLTVSRRQYELASARCDGLPVQIRLQDYRAIGNESYDRVASIGMFEHVGVRNYPRYFDVVRRCLGPDGLFLLHTIGRNSSTRSVDPWIERYIFPRGQLPSLRQVSAALEGRFVVEDLHNFGIDYDATLLAWYRRFDAAWPGLAGRYDEVFRRMWTFYLLGCAGAFRARDMQVWQFVLSSRGLAGGYRRPRW